MYWTRCVWSQRSCADICGVKPSQFPHLYKNKEEPWVLTEQHNTTAMTNTPFEAMDPISYQVSITIPDCKKNAVWKRLKLHDNTNWNSYRNKLTIMHNELTCHAPWTITETQCWTILLQTHENVVRLDTKVVQTQAPIEQTNSVELQC